MTYLSTLAQATSNAIKAAHSEFYKNLADSQSHASINPQMPFNNPKCPIPMRMKILNDPHLLNTHRETYLNIK